MNNAPQLANQVIEELDAIKQAFQNLLPTPQVITKNKNNSSSK